MARKGYTSYRGRRRGAKLLPVLLVLALALACAVMWLMSRVTYSDDGSIRLDLPFLEQGEEQTGGEDAGDKEPEEDLNLVIDKPQEDGERAEEPAWPLPTRKLLGLAALPTDETLLGSRLDQAGANGFVYTVRENTGVVRYRSAAAIRDAVAADAAPAELIEALCAGEDVYAVARLNAFHDSYYAWANMESAGICQATGHIWYDDLSYHWLDPDKQAAREYVISLAVECAQLGFDEILLEEMHYPAAGKLQKIDYSRNALAKTEALARFLTELRAALAPYGTTVSLLLDEKLLDSAAGGEYIGHSGQDLSVLLPLVDGVYMAAADPAAAAADLAEQAGESVALVPVAAGDVAGSENWYIAE